MLHFSSKLRLVSHYFLLCLFLLVFTACLLDHRLLFCYLCGVLTVAISYLSGIRLGYWVEHLTEGSAGKSISAAPPKPLPLPIYVSAMLLFVYLSAIPLERIVIEGISIQLFSFMYFAGMMALFFGTMLFPFIAGINRVFGIKNY